MQDGTNNTPRGRGRPRAYDADAVALRIVDTFWTHGYSATSLDRLASATGLNRPSLYAAFGDKKAMYRHALDAFAGQVRGEIERALAAPDLATALRQFYRSAIAVYRSGDAHASLPGSGGLRRRPLLSGVPGAAEVALGDAPPGTT